VREHLGRLGLISESDFSLFKVTDDIEEAVAEILTFYKVFHSYRYVGDKIVLRLSAKLTDDAVEKLNEEFSGIVKSGKIVQRNALDAESDELELESLNRIVFRHRRRDFGRLREFINAVNDSELNGRG
jgi:hypothetical protein